MTRFENVTDYGEIVVGQEATTTRGKTTYGIEYELSAVTDEDNVLIDAHLDIITPAAFIVVLQNLTSEQVDELIDKLNQEYSYDEGTCTSLKLPGSHYDVIFLNESITEKHPLGYNIDEKEYGTVDGHEVEICDVLTDYISNLRTTRDPSDHDSYIGYSVLYDTEVLPDDECVNIIDSCNKIHHEDPEMDDEYEIKREIVGMEDNLLATRFCVKRGFSYEDITFTFHHVREKHIATSAAAKK